VIVRCPQCGGDNRIRHVEGGEPRVKYLCGSCQSIVTLDLHRDEVPSSSSSGSFRSLAKRKKVLVADDSATTRELAAGLLGRAGYEVITAVDGAAALRAAREEHPDLVVLDLLMPRVSGFDVLREMKTEEGLRDVPVLVVSGVFKGNLIGFLQELGAAGFLDKGQIPDHLVFRVTGLLGADAPTEETP